MTELEKNQLNGMVERMTDRLDMRQRLKNRLGDVLCVLGVVGVVRVVVLLGAGA